MRLHKLAIETCVALLGAALLATSMLLPGAGPLAWIAIVPWALLYGRPGSHAGIVPGLIGIAVFILTVWGSLLKYGPFFAATSALDGMVIYGVGLMVLRSTSRWLPRLPVALRLAVVWTATEYMWVNHDFYRTSIFVVHNTLADWPVMIQSADVVGAGALSFPIALVNGLAVDAILLLRRRGKPAPSRAGAPLPGPSPRAVAACGIAAASIVLAMVAYGLARIDRTEPQPGPRMALVQPAIPHIIGWPLGVHIEELWQTARDVPRGSSDLILWPENSVLDFYDLPHRYLDDLTWLARTRDARILFGAMGRARSNPFRTTNNALLLSPEGKIEGSYEKIDVIPWAEYFPFESVLSVVAPSVNILHLKLTMDALGYFPTGTAGERTTLFPYTWQGRSLPFSVVLCSEGSIPRHARDGARLGAKFLVNLISEGDTGPGVQRNLLRVCSMRAVENRMPFIRVGNTGISCAIDESGRIRDVLRDPVTGRPSTGAGVLMTRVPLPAHPRTAIYTSLGDVVPLGCVALSVLAFAFGLPGSLRRVRPPALAPALLTTGLLAVGLLAVGLSIDCRPRLGAGAADFDSALDRGLKAFKEGRDKIALRVLERASASAPARSEPYPYIAEILRRRKQSYYGYRFFTARKDLALRDPEIAAYLGYFQTELHQKQDAVESFRLALAANPGQRAALVWLAALLADSRRAAELVPYIEKFLALHPEDREARLLLADAWLSCDRLDKAHAVLDRVASEAPRDAILLRLQGLLAFLEGRLKDAAALMAASERADPKCLETRYHEARIALALGDLQGSRAAIDGLHQLEKKGEFH